MWYDKKYNRQIVAVISRTKVEGSAAFMAKTPPRIDGCSRSSAQERHARWCIDCGASDHMTSCKADFLCFRHGPKVWVKGICAYAEVVGNVKVNMRDSTGKYFLH
jgi:hypothetical protein